MTVRQVACHVYKNDIAEITRRRANGANPGDTTYLPAFQGAVSELLEGLEEGDLFDLEVKRAEWLNECHPIDVQRKNADKMGRGYIQTSAESQYKEMGMRSVVWEFHENKAGVKLFQLLSRLKFSSKYLSDKLLVATTIMIV